MTSGCDGVFSGRESGGRCIVGICGRPDGRPDWPPPSPPAPGGHGSGSGPARARGSGSRAGHHGRGSSGVLGLLPRALAGALPSPSTGESPPRPASPPSASRRAIDRRRPRRRRASIRPAFGDRASGRPACALPGFGVRGSLVAGARRGREFGSVLAPDSVGPPFPSSAPTESGAGAANATRYWHHRPTARKPEASRPRRCAHANPLRHHPPHASPSAKFAIRRLSHNRTHRFAGDRCCSSAGQARTVNATGR